MADNDIDKLKEFMKMVEMSNTDKYKEQFVQNVDGLKIFSLVDENIEVIRRVIEDAHEMILKRLELYIRSEVLETQRKIAQERCKIEATVYNFMKGDIPGEIKELYKNGLDAVPDIRLSKKVIKERVESTLIQYMERYRSWHSKEKHIEAEGVLEWI